MDRSFLSQPEVVAASRSMVCVRLATYENAAEARFLASVFTGGSGQLENTVFAILAPDGRTPLVRSGRSPREFSSAAALAATMMSLVRSTHASRCTAEMAGVPRVETVRLALNVAACDHLPLLVTYGATRHRVQQLEATLAETAWTEGVQGRVIFTSTARAADVQAFTRGAVGEGYYLIRPDEYGLHGSIVATFDERSVATLAAASAAYHTSAMAPMEHIRQGHQQGVRWQTQIPVTDPLGRY